MVKYTDDELLNHLTECYDRYGKVTQQLLNQDDDFASGVLIGERFGGLNEARKQADLPTRNKGQNYTDEEVIELLEECQERHNCVGSAQLRQDDDLPGLRPVQRVFGDLESAREELDLDKPYNGMAKEEVDKGLKTLYEEEGNVNKRLINDSEKVTMSSVKYHYDTLSNALNKVDLGSVAGGVYGRKELLNELKNHEEEYGYCSGRALNDHDGYPSAEAIKNEFGSLEEAFEEANVARYNFDKHFDVSKAQTYTDKELKRALRECAERYGKVNWVTLSKANDLPEASTIVNRFGDLEKASERAGVSESYTLRVQYTEGDIDEHLTQCKEKYGYISQRALLEDDDLCSPQLIQDHYGSVRKAADAFGMEYGERVCPVCETHIPDDVATHWSRNDCSPLNSYRKELLTGMALGDGVILQNHSFQTVMTNYPFLDWLDEELGPITTGVSHKHTPEKSASKTAQSGFRENADPENYRHTYHLSGRKLDWLSTLRDWYEDGQIRYPDSLELTPITAKIWYASDGHLNPRGNPTAYITSRNERENLDKIAEWFNDNAPTPEVRGPRLAFHNEKAYELLDWMGEAPPGFEYKWETEDLKHQQKLKRFAYADDHYWNNFD